MISPQQDAQHRPDDDLLNQSNVRETPDQSMALTYTCSLPQGSISYGMKGKGVPLLMIMGFMARGHGWRSQVEALSQTYQTVWFDHRGVGESPGPAASSMKDFSRDCVALLDHLGWENAHIFGVSMGGMIAQELALQAPTRVRSLTLIVTQSGGVTSMIPTRTGIPLFLGAQFARTPERRIQSLKSLLVPFAPRSPSEEREIDRRLREEFTPKPPFPTMPTPTRHQQIAS